MRAMKFAVGAADLAALAVLGLVWGVASPAIAGGAALDDDDHHDQAYYFGFVKDTSGNIVPDAKVTAKIKNISIITHTDILGAYKIAAFNSDVKPEEFGLSCSKEGYRQASVLRRTPGGDGKDPVEVDCTLQRE
jgi:hypothetical protein